MNGTWRVVGLGQIENLIIDIITEAFVVKFYGET